MKVSAPLNPVGDLKVDFTFGKTTIADRLPVPSIPCKSIMAGDCLWVPRMHDAQIDIFSMNGELVNTVLLEPLSPELNGLVLSSSAILGETLDVQDPKAAMNVIRQYPRIAQLYHSGNYVISRRENSHGKMFRQVFDLIHKDGTVVPNSFFARDLALMGSSSSSVFMITSPGINQTHMPSWETTGMALDSFKDHQGLWLVRLNLSFDKGGQ